MSLSLGQRAWRGLCYCGPRAQSCSPKPPIGSMCTDRDWGGSFPTSCNPKFPFFLKRNGNGFQAPKNSKHFLNLLTSVLV